MWKNKISSVDTYLWCENALKSYMSHVMSLMSFMEHVISMLCFFGEKTYLPNLVARYTLVSLFTKNDMPSMERRLIGWGGLCRTKNPTPM